MLESSSNLGLSLDRLITFDGSAVDKPWLIDIDPSTVHLAGGKPDLQFEQCAIYLGDRPVILDFHGLALQCLKERLRSVTGREVDDTEERARLEQVKKLRPYWKYYLVLYGLGISKCDARLKEVGLKIIYKDPSPNKDRRSEGQECIEEPSPITIMDYWPKSESRDVAKVESSVNLDIDLYGKIEASSSVLDPILKVVPLPFGAELKLGGKGNVVAQLSFKLAIPLVESFGCYSSSGMWTFHRHQNQQLLGHLIHTTSAITHLHVDAIVSAIYGGYFWTRATERKHVPLQPVPLTEED